MSGKLVKLATFLNPVEAEMARNRLEEAGIPAAVTGGTAGVFAGMGAFSELVVEIPEEHLERATALLDSLANAAVEPSAEDTAAFLEWQESLHAEPGSNGAPAVDATGRSDVDGDMLVAPPAREEPDERHSVRMSAEGLANRAWRAAVFGLIVFPLFLHLYSVWLLLRLAVLPHEVTPRTMRRIYGALLIDGFVFTVVGLVLRAALL